MTLHDDPILRRYHDLRPDPREAPGMQSLVLFEHYESDGSLLLVTSNGSDIRLEPGDVIYRREWMPCAAPDEWNRARKKEDE